MNCSSWCIVFVLLEADWCSNQGAPSNEGGFSIFLCLARIVGFDESWYAGFLGNFRGVWTTCWTFPTNEGRGNFKIIWLRYARTFGTLVVHFWGNTLMGTFPPMSYIWNILGWLISPEPLGWFGWIFVCEIISYSIVGPRVPRREIQPNSFQNTDST